MSFTLPQGTRLASGATFSDPFEYGDDLFRTTQAEVVPPDDYIITRLVQAMESAATTNLHLAIHGSANDESIPERRGRIRHHDARERSASPRERPGARQAWRLEVAQPQHAAASYQPLDPQQSYGINGVLTGSFAHDKLPPTFSEALPQPVTSQLPCPSTPSVPTYLPQAPCLSLPHPHGMYVDTPAASEPFCRAITFDLSVPNHHIAPDHSSLDFLTMIDLPTFRSPSPDHRPIRTGQGRATSQQFLPGGSIPENKRSGTLEMAGDEDIGHKIVPRPRKDHDRTWRIGGDQIQAKNPQHLRELYQALSPVFVMLLELRKRVGIDEPLQVNLFQNDISPRYRDLWKRYSAEIQRLQEGLHAESDDYVSDAIPDQGGLDTGWVDYLA